MSADIRGSTSVVAQPLRVSVTPEGKWEISRSYRGSKQAIIDALNANQFKGGVSATIAEGGEIVERFGTLGQFTSGGLAGQVQDDTLAEDRATWDLIPVELERPLREHPDFVSYGTQSDLDEIDDYIAVGDKAGLRADTYTGDADKYKTLRLRNTDSFIDYAFTIRYTRNVSRETFLEPDVSSWGQVSAPTVPNIDAVRKTVDALDLEWLKKAPTISYVGGDRFQIVQEWLGVDEWSAILYGGSATP